jgi:hypothetical protein
MVKTARSKAEEQFAKLQKQPSAAPSESEIAAAELGAKMARLKALRLAKETAGRENAAGAKSTRGGA